MVFKRLFKDKQAGKSGGAPPVPRTPGSPLVHELALRIRGTFDLDEILQLAADAVGEHLKADHCLIYLCDPNTDRLRWRAGHHSAGLAPWRWSLKESNFPGLFTRLRKAETVRIDDPLNDPLTANARSMLESANIRSLVFIPALSDQLEAVLILGQVHHARQWSDEDIDLLRAVAAEVAIACRHMNLTLALRQAGNEAYSATVELQTENQYLQWLTQLLLFPSTDPAQVLDHMSASLSELYNVDVCSIEQVQDEMVHVRSIRLPGQTTNLGVFPIEGTPRQPVVEKVEKSISTNAIEAYPQDRFLRENGLVFYAGVPIVNRRGNLIGLLNLFHHETVNLQDRDFNLLSAIARRIAFELEAELSAGGRPEEDEETRRRLQAVTQAEQEIKQRFAEVMEAEQHMRHRREELVQAEHDLQQQRDDLAQAQRDLQQQRDQLAQAEHDLQQQRDDLAQAQDNLQQRLDQVTQAEHDLQQQRDDLAQAQDNLQQRLDQVTQAEHDLQQQRDQLAQAEHDLQRRLDEVAQTEQTIQQQLEAATEVAPGEAVDWRVFSDLLALMEQGSSIEQVCASLVEEVIELLPGSAAAIWLVNRTYPLPAGRQGPSGESASPGAWEQAPQGSQIGVSLPLLIHVAGRGEPVETLAAQGPIPLGEGALGQVASSRELLAISDVHQSEDVPNDLRALASSGQGYTSATIVPLKAQDKTLGVMLILGADSTPAQPEACSFLEALATCLANFIERSQMMETVSRHTEELTKMRTMIESMSRPSTLAQVCDDILHNVADSLDASHGALYLLEAGAKELRLFRQRGLEENLVSLGQRLSVAKVQQSLAALADGEPLIISDLEAESPLTNQRAADALRVAGLRSGVVLPLQANNELVGLLILASREPNHFSHYSAEFLSIITHRIADTIQTSGIRPPALAVPHIARLSETLLENLSSGVVATDRDGRITIFNPAMERLTGLEQQDALGQPLAVGASPTPRGRGDTTLPAGRAGAGSAQASAPLRLFSNHNPFDEVLTHARPVTRKETQLLTKDGSSKVVSMTVMPLTDDRGALVGAVGLFTDMTEVRALEHERYRLTPLALIGEMSARLAHEIKNPLASMMSGLELLKRRLKYGEREGRYFERLMAELQRLDTTVREMLAYSRTAPPTLEPIDPTVPVEQALDTLAPQLEAAHIEVTRDYQPELAPATLDANQIEQAFLNLIINAIQAMPDGGQLRLSVHTVPVENENGTQTTAIEYAVSDTGIGIPPDAADKIFDPFFSTKTHGTGLGLASVKKIVESHRGQIHFQSQPDVGTTFVIRL